jgi:peptidoglycan/xylan/chitin deacetylase (PgdA/CDA1 family)
MRSAVIAAIALASLASMAGAHAAECPAGAMGVSRTIVVDPSEHSRLGSQQYSESLPLRDKEVVLTFDDGPLPPYTNRILETLASECVKATFFMVGRMARGYPSIVRRIYNEGHTVANHSQNHPFTFHKMTVDQASLEIEDGFSSIRTALGPNAKGVAPFFRIPGLLRQNSVEQYLAAHNVMTWSVDVVADDWTHISSSEVARRAVSRLEAHRKGILLLHDIQPATALAFPEILHELKVRGFKIVHVVPATADRPKTATLPEQWMARAPSAEMKVWPRLVNIGVTAEEPQLEVPSPKNFGLPEVAGAPVKVALVPNFDRPPVREGEIPLPPITPWPRQLYSAPVERETLAAPAAQNFKYTRVFKMPGSERSRKPAATQVASKPKDPNQPATTGATPTAHTAEASPPRKRETGHQFSVVRPPLNIFPNFR